MRFRLIANSLALTIPAGMSARTNKKDAIMRVSWRTVLVIAILVGGSMAFGPIAARAQEPGLGVILGGYGAMAGGPGSSMGGGFNIVDSSGMGGSVIVPAAGGLGAAMSPSMKAGGLSFRSRPAATMETARPSFGLGGAMGAMNKTAGGMGGRRPFTLQQGSLMGGTGLGGMRKMSGAGRMGVMPPSIGYPFRQPPSLLTPSSSATGMSM